MPDLNIFGFQSLWSPYFFCILSAVLCCYYFFTVTYQSKIAGSEPLTKKQAAFFTLAIVLLYIIKGSPLDVMGHITFYTHMMQMASLFYIIPPLLIIGIPPWIWRKIFSIPVFEGFLRFFSKPLIALILFNGLFSIYHIPVIFDMIKTDIFLHAGYTGLLFLLAINMWWPLLNELKEHQSLSGLKKVGYIFANGVLITPACALIIFSNIQLYETYADTELWMKAMELCISEDSLQKLNITGPEMFQSMPLLEDQQLGGVLMKIIQELVFGVILAKIFFAWYRQDQEEAAKQYHPFNPQK
ncbi:cytochrome c oxidase assembly factor CtaG [Bacillaceae bacterium Marseille-Q3522]|nr:cytochrome c oxidase assembly factor CtaG [Bacillaceae bacterium Marseille-Q3522]